MIKAAIELQQSQVKFIHNYFESRLNMDLVHTKIDSSRFTVKAQFNQLIEDVHPFITMFNIYIKLTI